MSLLPFRDALVTIYDADSAVQAITGRSELNLVPRGAQRYEENLPALTYFVVLSPQMSGTKGRRKVLLQLEAWAEEGVGVFTELETLMDRAEVLFVGADLTAQGIDVSRVRVASRIDGPVEDGVRSLRADFNFVVTTV